MYAIGKPKNGSHERLPFLCMTVFMLQCFACICTVIHFLCQDSFYLFQRFVRSRRDLLCCEAIFSHVPDKL